MYALISPFFKSFDDQWLTYLVPDFLVWEIKQWQIVEIPFKENIEYWVIISLNNSKNIDFDDNKIKSLISIKDENIFLDKYRNKLLTRISSYYFTAIHNSNSLFFPKNLLEKIKKGKIDFNKIWNFDYKYNNQKDLNSEQLKSLNEIKSSKNNKILFYWLTWTWKTEIYINLIKEYIDNNKQVLFMIPEIILTNQLSKRIIDVFWEDVLIINSSITEASKTKNWLSINSWNAKIIIWTRSALFYPFNDLWLIIIDEEHDNSYISDSSPRYNTIEVAEKITELNWNKLILASWTPSVKSMYKWIKNEYEIVNLFNVYKKED